MQVICDTVSSNAFSGDRDPLKYQTHHIDFIGNFFNLALKLKLKTSADFDQT